MSNIFRTVKNLTNIVPGGLKLAVNQTTSKPIARSIWSLRSTLAGNVKVKPMISQYGFQYDIRNTHTENTLSGEKELVEFLNDEIDNERSLLKSKTIPSQINGFQVKLNGSEVKLIKKSHNETVEVSFNINFSVSPAAEPDIDPSLNMDDYSNMVSRPAFKVDIKKGDTTLGFSCTFLDNAGVNEEQQESENYNDIFAIEDLSLYTGEWKDENYSVSGEVLDGCLYDLLMNILEDKGISNEFVDQLSQLSTTYEHTTYINLLQDLKKFVSK